jgi:hypothetical protein
LIKSQFAQEMEEGELEKDEVNYDSEEIRFREKKLLGKSLGLVQEKRVKPLTHEEKQQLGVEYLKHIRGLPRKPPNSSSIPSKTA